jgi:hypothetical protein
MILKYHYFFECGNDTAKMAGILVTQKVNRERRTEGIDKKKESAEWHFAHQQIPLQTVTNIEVV